MPKNRESGRFRKTGSAYNLKMYTIEENQNDAEPFDPKDQLTAKGPIALRNRALKLARIGKTDDYHLEL